MPHRSLIIVDGLIDSVLVSLSMFRTIEQLY